MKTSVIGLVSLALALAGCNGSGESVTLETGIIGSWRSENVGLDFPMWMVKTFQTDGTVKTEFYSKRKGKIIHHVDASMSREWRMVDGFLHMGKTQPDGTFKTEGRPRTVSKTSSGTVLIDGYTREK